MAAIDSRYVNELRHGWDAKLRLQDTSTSFKESIKTIYHYGNLQHNEWACKLQEVLLVLGSTRRREKIQDLRGDPSRMMESSELRKKNSTTAVVVPPTAVVGGEGENQDEGNNPSSSPSTPAVSLKDERNFLEAKVEHWEQVKQRCNTLLVEVDEHVGGYTDEFMRNMALITEEVKAAPWAGHHYQDPWQHLPTFHLPRLIDLARDMPPTTIDATRFGVEERHSWGPVSRSKLPHRTRSSGVKITCSALATMDAPYMKPDTEFFIGTGSGAVLGISLETLSQMPAIPPGTNQGEKSAFAVPGAALPPGGVITTNSNSRSGGAVVANGEYSSVAGDLDYNNLNNTLNNTSAEGGDLMSRASTSNNPSPTRSKVGRAAPQTTAGSSGVPSHSGAPSQQGAGAGAAAVAPAAPHTPPVGRTSTVEEVSKALREKLNTECNNVRAFDGPMPNPLHQPHEIIVLAPTGGVAAPTGGSSTTQKDGGDTVGGGSGGGSASGGGSRQATPSVKNRRSPTTPLPIVGGGSNNNLTVAARATGSSKIAGATGGEDAAARPVSSSAAHREVTSVPGVRILKNHVYPVTGVHLIKYAEGKWLLATTSIDKTVRVSNAVTGQLMCILHATAAVITSVEVHPELKYLVTTALDGTVAAWDAYTGDRIGILAKLKVGITALHICPRIKPSPSSFLTPAAAGGGTPTATQSDGSTGKSPGTTTAGSGGSNSEWIMLVGCKNGHIYELNTPPLYQVGAKTKIAGICTSASCYLPHGALPSYPPKPDARSAAAAKGVSCTTDVDGLMSCSRITKEKDGQQEQQAIVYGGHKVSSHITCMHTIAGFLVSGDSRGQVVHWDTVHQHEVRSMAGGHVDSITAIQSSQDGFLFTGSRDGLVLVRNLNDGSLLSRLNAHFGPVTGLLLTLAPARIRNDSTVRDRSIIPSPAASSPLHGVPASSIKGGGLKANGGKQGVVHPSGQSSALSPSSGATPSVTTMGSFALGKVPDGYDAILLSVSEDESILAWTLRYDVDE